MIIASIESWESALSNETLFITIGQFLAKLQTNVRWKRSLAHCALDISNSAEYPHFKGIYFVFYVFIYGPGLTSIGEYWHNKAVYEPKF